MIAEAHDDLLLDIGLVGGDDVSEGRVAFVSERLVETRNGARRGPSLADVLEGQLRLLGNFLVGRLPFELQGQLALGARDLRSRSTMWTGIRIVRDLFATPRCTAWRIHQVA